MNKIKFKILVSFFLLIAVNSFSGNYLFTDTTYIIDNEITESIIFNDYTTVYKSETNYNLHQLLSKIKKGEIKKTDNSAARGFTKDYFWIFFRFKNITNKDIEFILKNSTPNIDSVILVSINNNRYDTLYITGKKIPFNKRIIKSNQIFFPFKIKANTESKTFVLKVSRIGDTMVFPLSIENTKQYYKSVENRRLFHFIYFSFLFVLLLISIALGILIKQRILIMYGFYALTLGLYFFSYKAYTVEFVYQVFPSIKDYSSMLKPFILVAFTQFLISFLELKKHNKWLYIYYNTLSIISVLIIIILFINYSVTKLYVFIIFYYVSIFTLVSTPVTLTLLYKKNKAAVITFILALVPIMTGTLTAMFVGLGYFPGRLLKYDLMLVGSVFEIIIFAIAIMYRINRLEVSRRKLLLKNVETQKEMLKAYQTGSKNKNTRISNELDTRITEKLDNIQEMLKNNADKDIIKKHISAVYEDVRIISHKLSHQTLKIAGLKSSLKTLIIDVSKNTQIEISINFLDFIDLFDKKAMYIYNVIQEAIDNAINHSQCKKITIEIIEHDDETNFTIDDDGIGFDINELKTKTNILNMQTRIELIGGIFEINSYPNKGTNIFFSIPKEQNKNIQNENNARN